MLGEQELWEEEEKEGLVFQEVVVQQQVERQQQPLKEQNELLADFLSHEAALVNRELLADVFDKEVTEYPNWELANFHIAGTGLDSTPELRGHWTPACLTPSAAGLQLRALILRSRSLLALKSIACEVQLQVRLAGEASLWIMTRAAALKDAGGVVCKVSKEQDAHRVFLAFGGHVGTRGEFRFFKRQEVPILGPSSEEAVRQDYIDLKLTLVDNGDDKVFLRAITSNRSNFRFMCNKFIPKLTDCPLMLAGSGDSVLLKTAGVKQVGRIDSFSRNPRHTECCQLL